MDNKLLLALLIGAAIIYFETQDDGDDDQSEDLVDTTMTTIDQAAALLTGPGPVENMSTSQAMLSMMMARESLRLTPYNLGDGGMTIGYGHQYQKWETVPASITQDQAVAMFENDVVNRAEKWVKLYVTVDLTQNQFDALVSVAYNMSPQSFKKFADQVNAGNGIDDIAQSSVGWVAAVYTNGIQNRRDAEMNVYDNGIYA
jgi:lysozyme